MGDRESHAMSLIQNSSAKVIEITAPSPSPGSSPEGKWGPGSRGSLPSPSLLHDSRTLLLFLPVSKGAASRC